MVATTTHRAIVATLVAVFAAATVCGARQPTLTSKSSEARVERGPTDGPGWTAFVPSGDSRVVYVSSSLGSDSNSGLSAEDPVQTLDAGYSLMRDGFPDWLLLKRGDVWSESFPEWQKGGRQTSEPMVIGSYGSGPRPLLNTGSGRGFISIAYPDPLAHLALTDIHFRADRADGSSPDTGVTFLNKWSDVLVENCKVEGYSTNMVVEQLNGRPSNIRLRRCVLVDAFSAYQNSQGIYTGSVDGLLIEECVFDHNGWRRGVPGAHARIFNHNMYLHDSCTAVVTRGNISARASATGISQRSGGICEDNLLIKNPTGLFMGGGQSPSTSGVRHAVRNNLAFDSRDIDTQSPRGFGLWIAGVWRMEVYGNIVSHHRSGTENVIAINLASEMNGLSMARNIVYDWTLDSSGLAVSADLSRGRGVIITDNVFVQPRGGFLIGYIRNQGADEGRVFGRNHYFTSNTLPHQFYYGMDYGDWVSQSDEIYANFTSPQFPDGGRNVESFMTSIGLQPSMETFLSLAREQERGAWDTRFTAGGVAAHVRAGYGVGKRGCGADFNDDGATNSLDLVAFQVALSSLDPRADTDLDGQITVADISTFQTRFAAGCP